MRRAEKTPFEPDPGASLEVQKRRREAEEPIQAVASFTTPA